MKDTIDASKSKASGFVKELKEFAMRGNVIDMAVGIIIGGAFGKIVSSLVSDVIMPPIGLLLGGVDFKDMKWVIRDAQPAIMDGDTVISEAIQAVSLNYGLFINSIIDFVLIAFAIFIMIKALNSARRNNEPAEAPAPPAPPEPSKEEKLLTEIRDILKTQSLKQ